LLAFDDKLLVGLRQFLEWSIDIDLFASAGAHKILLRFAKLIPAKNTDRALFDRQRAIGNRFIQIDRDRATEPAAFRTRAKRIVEREKSRRWLTNIQIAMRAMPTGAERMRDEGRRLKVFEKIDFPFSESESGFERFNQSRAIFISDLDSVLNDLDARAESLDLRV